VAGGCAASHCGGIGLNLTTIRPDPGNARQRRLDAMRDEDTDDIDADTRTRLAMIVEQLRPRQ
jgi:hypothetical protein